MVYNLPLLSVHQVDMTGHHCEVKKVVRQEDGCLVFGSPTGQRTLMAEEQGPRRRNALPKSVSGIVKPDSDVTWFWSRMIPYNEAYLDECSRYCTVITVRQNTGILLAEERKAILSMGCANHPEFLLSSPCFELGSSVVLSEWDPHLV